MDLSDIIPLLVIIGIPVLRRTIRQQDRTRPRRSGASGQAGRRNIHERPVLYPRQEFFPVEEPKAPVIEQDDADEGISLERPEGADRLPAAEPVRRKEEKPAAKETFRDEMEPSMLFKDNGDLVRAVIMTEVFGPPRSRKRWGKRHI